ncbi:MAG: preprotein translocase subunit SecE [Victivallales bacterium]|nr:preprotein translocase subunit SecE [Victivallales bacterium]
MNKVAGNVKRFLIGSAAELKKCSWPGKKELMESTLLVIVAIAILASFVFIVDLLCRNSISLITK